jgi:hypothetical protein
MFSTFINSISDRRALRTDVPIAICLIALDVAARLLPHAPDFTPVAATALFAASVFRARALAVLVPVAGMILGDMILGFYDLQVMIVVYAALALPASVALLPRRLWPRLIAPFLLSSSLIFFVVTNFAVWAFSSMYPANVAGLLKCYIAALPFLRNMLVGDLFWGLVLFGLYGLTRTVGAPKDERVPARAVVALARF